MPNPVHVGYTVSNQSPDQQVVQQLDQGAQVSGYNYANAFTPGMPNLLVGDPGISQIVDPLASSRTAYQQPVVTDIVQVEKTSPWVLVSLGVLAYLVIFRKGIF
jgi:hypothetical protein